MLRRRLQQGVLKTEHEFVIALSSAVDMASLLLSGDKIGDAAQLCSMLVRRYLTNKEAGLILALTSDSAPSDAMRKRPRIDMQTSYDSRQILSAKNITDLPEELLQGILSFLLFKEKAALFSVNKAWKKAVQKDGFVFLDWVQVGTRMNEALLFAARNLPKIERVFLGPPAEVKSGFALGGADNEDFYFSGHRLDIFLRTAPMLKAFVVDFEGCDPQQVASILRNASNLGAIS